MILPLNCINRERPAKQELVKPLYAIDDGESLLVQLGVSTLGWGEGSALMKRPLSKILYFSQGKRYEADLLSNGLIAWNGATYTSPYAWASQCKNLVNPDHKSGIGWGHVSLEWHTCTIAKILIRAQFFQPLPLATKYMYVVALNTLKKKIQV